MGRRDVGAARTSSAGEPARKASGRPPRDLLQDYLGQAPPELQEWARQQLASLEDPSDADTPDDDRRDTNPADDDPVDDDLVDELDDELDGDEAPEEESRDPGPERRRSSVPAPRGPVSRLLRSRRTLVVVGLLVVAAVVVGVRGLGRDEVPGMTGADAAEATTQGAAPLDTAKVAELMGRISADPKDVDALTGLADLYFAAADYETSGSWQRKALEVDPENVTARLGLGAAQFNLGDAAGAEQEWLRVVKLDPGHAEAHYDLGFLYLSQDPPDLAKVRREWTKVIAIAPDSQIAKTVSTHLQSLGTAPSGAAASSSPSASSSSAGGE